MFLNKILLSTLFLILSSCSSPDWLGFEKKKVKIEGKRISILGAESLIKDEDSFSDNQIIIPAKKNSDIWAQKDGLSSHASMNYSASNNIEFDYKFSVGKGEDDSNRILSQPIIVNDRIYVLDAESVLRSFDLSSSNLVWKINLRPDSETTNSSIGGGLAVSDNKVFISTAYGEVFALKLKSGEQIWKKNIKIPIRSAPTAADGKLFILTLNNKLFVLNQLDGNELWRHETSDSMTSLMTSAKPAVDNEIVVVPYSNGEVFALRLENGNTAWSDSLVDLGKIDTTNELADIDAGPVISNELIIVASAIGKIVAIEKRSGIRVWEQAISTIETPTLVGNSVYVISTNSELICLDKQTGKLQWVKSLIEEYGDRAKNRWFSPLITSDKLVIVGGDGMILRLDPYTGEIEKELKISHSPASRTIAYLNRLFILTRDSRIISFN